MPLEKGKIHMCVNTVKLTVLITYTSTGYELLYNLIGSLLEGY